MESLADLSEAEFEEVLLQEPMHVRGLQILTAGFIAGLVMFSVAVLSLHLTGALRQEGMEPIPDLDGEVGEESLPFLVVLSGIHVVVALGSWMAAAVLSTVLFSPRALRRAAAARAGTTSGAHACLNLIRQMTLLRAALIEGPGLFGLVVCLVGGAGGEIADQPLYWLNASTALIAVIALGMTFPTRDRLLDIFRLRIASARGAL